MAKRETWFLLFGGHSADGRGEGVYQGRTTDVTEAAEHMRLCVSDPYSTGGVQIVTDESFRCAFNVRDIMKHAAERRTGDR